MAAQNQAFIAMEGDGRAPMDGLPRPYFLQPRSKSLTIGSAKRTIVRAVLIAALGFGVGSD